MGFRYEESEWPIVCWRWTGDVTDHELQDCLARMDGYLGRGQRFGLMIDARGAGGLSPEQRNRAIERLRLQADLSAQLMVQAVLFDTLIQRTLYYGIHVLFPVSFPSRVFASPDSARAWLIEMVGPPGVEAR